MSYINNGYKRFKTLTVKVKINGVVQSTNVLPFMSAFTHGTTYPLITADDNSRATAYAAYVQENYQSQYPGLTVSAIGSRIYDVTACPLP